MGVVLFLALTVAPAWAGADHMVGLDNEAGRRCEEQLRSLEQCAKILHEIGNEAPNDNSNAGHDSGPDNAQENKDDLGFQNGAAGAIAAVTQNESLLEGQYALCRRAAENAKSACVEDEAAAGKNVESKFARAENLERSLTNHYQASVNQMAGARRNFSNIRSITRSAPAESNGKK